MLRKDLRNPYWILLYRKEKKKQANWSEPIKKWHNFFSLSKISGLILFWYTYFVQITNVKSLQTWNRFCFGLQNNFRFGNVTKYIVNQQRIGCQILAWLKKIWICLGSGEPHKLETKISRRFLTWFNHSATAKLMMTRAALLKYQELCALINL